jgi:hypothetical protein
MLVDRKLAILFLFAFLVAAGLMFMIMYNFYQDNPPPEQLQNNLIKK